MGKNDPPRRARVRVLEKMKVCYGNLMNHFLVALLFMTLIIVILSGVGNVLIISVAGTVLCLAGCMQGAVTVDLWVFIPLLVFDAFSMASSWHTYGTIAEGFAPTQTIFTVLYLLMAHLNDRERIFLRRLCILWVGSVAAIGIVGFTFQAQTHLVGRLGGLLGNPNAFGIFLVVGWFALRADSRESGGLEWLEPVILAALAMTLSMGSFLALAAGVFILCLKDWKCFGLRQAFFRTCQTLARGTLGMGVGLLLYVAGRMTDMPWLCILLVLYVVAAAVDWRNISAFLKNRPQVAVLLTGAGIVVAVVSVLLRPSAAATFTERLKMMESGLHYITKNPLLGVGPYQWRRMDYHDGGIYFNTWHIHNLFLHVGVELGLVAMVALMAVALRHFLKRGEPDVKAGSAAFLLHCMMDTGFFYEAVPVLTLLTVGTPQKGGRRLAAILNRTIFGLLSVVFVYDLFHLRL